MNMMWRNLPGTGSTHCTRIQDSKQPLLSCNY